MSRMRNTPLLLALVVCVLVVAALMVAAIFVAGQRPLVVVLPPNGTPAGPAPAIAGGVPGSAATPGAAPAGSPAAAPAAKAVELVVVRLPATPPVSEVLDPAWNKVPAVEIPLQPQQTTVPMLAAATVPAVSAQAVHDGRRIAWRLSWPATQPSTRTESGQFSDAVAMQFPMADGAPFTMGGKGLPVRVLYWRALWQRDADEGFQDVGQLYPNATADLYWFAPGAATQPAAEAFRDPRAQQFMPAIAAGNPMAELARKMPLEEIVAEGFGSATHVPSSPSGAKGVWRDGRWTVVIDRPEDAADPLIARLQTAGGSLVSFAVWDGSAENRGGRKHYCVWVPLRIEP